MLESKPLIFDTPPTGGILDTAVPAVKPNWGLGDHSGLATGWSSSRIDPDLSAAENQNVGPDLNPRGIQAQEIDPFYLFACYLEWELSEEPDAAWELIAAAQSSHEETRAHARTLLTRSRHFGPLGSNACSTKPKRSALTETDMNSPYGLDIVDDCSACTQANPGFFCRLSSPA